MIEAIIEKITFRLSLDITACSAVHGGDINKAFKLTDSHNNEYFLKYNYGPNHDSIIKSEVDGLALFHSHGINAPDIIDTVIGPDCSYILMPFISPNPKGFANPKATENFVSVLVKLHSVKSTYFGYNKDNCIGSLHQSNAQYDSFGDYYWKSRIEPQLQMAQQKFNISSLGNTSKLKEVLYQIPSEAPCLIHGDLWSGNHLISEDQQAFLIDPSISYGHREMDIAMMLLFGGFPHELIEMYNHKLPLTQGWKERMELFQLYYLLVHLNLFGTSYLPSVSRIINKYTL
jgi:fructosamine-3-kinase